MALSQTFLQYLLLKTKGCRYISISIRQKTNSLHNFRTQQIFFHKNKQVCQMQRISTENDFLDGCLNWIIEMSVDWHSGRAAWYHLVQQRDNNDTNFAIHWQKNFYSL